MGEDRSQTSRQRVTVAQAAEILGVTVEAVRGRIKRKKLEHERHSGTVYVLLPADQMPTGCQPGDDQTTDQPQSEVRSYLPKTRPLPPCATSSKPSARPTPKQGACSWPPWSGSRRS